MAKKLMGNGKMQDILKSIDKDLVEEASKQPTKPKRVLRIRRRCVVLISLTILIMGVVGGIKLSLSWGSLNIGHSTEDEILAASYPKGYSFEDYDAKFAIREENEVRSDTLEAINQFTYNSASILLNKQNTNQMYSPISLYYALALAVKGANGKTKQEMLGALCVAEQGDIGAEAGKLYRLLYTKNEIGQLQIANSLWLGKSFQGKAVTYQNSFIEEVKDDFYASLYSVDYQDSSTGDAMKKWVEENTNGTLEYEYQPENDQLLTILNTIYYYDEWTERFDTTETKMDSFTKEDHDVITMDFMNREEVSASFSRGNGFTRSSLGLKNGGEMIFILPDAGVTVGELTENADLLQEVFTGGTSKSGRVTWKIPKFRYNSSFDLNEMLQQLGVEKAFGEEADFSGITTTPSFISKVRQDTHIAIDEKGVEASAYTEISYCGSAMPEDEADMILDRPFIYGIEKDGVLLFMGTFYGE